MRPVEKPKDIVPRINELNRILAQMAQRCHQASRVSGSVSGEPLRGLRAEISRAACIGEELLTLFSSRSARSFAGEEEEPFLRNLGDLEPGSQFIVSRVVVPASPPPGPSSPKIPPGELCLKMDEPVEITILNPGGGRELIMFVDDDPLAVELAREILQYHDYRVVVASNGLEALHIYKKLGSQIALVILDLFMPLVDGDAVFDELKALNPDVRVVLSSGCCGFTEQGKIRHMLQQGLCGFIPKPYTEKKLIDQVRTTLAA